MTTRKIVFMSTAIVAVVLGIVLYMWQQQASKEKCRQAVGDAKEALEWNWQAIDEVSDQYILVYEEANAQRDIAKQEAQLQYELAMQEPETQYILAREEALEEAEAQFKQAVQDQRENSFGVDILFPGLSTVLPLQEARWEAREESRDEAQLQYELAMQKPETQYILAKEEAEAQRDLAIQEADRVYDLAKEEAETRRDLATQENNRQFELVMKKAEEKHDLTRPAVFLLSADKLCN